MPVQLTRERDVEVFERPLLTILRSKRNELYLRSWCDGDDLSDRWLVFRSREIDLLRYLHKKLTLRDLILGCADGFVFAEDEIATAHEPGHHIARSVALVPVTDLPDEILPLPLAYHNPQLDPGFVDERNIRAVMFEGGDALKVMSNFEHTYEGVYSFLYILGLDSIGRLPYAAFDRFKEYVVKRSGFPRGKMFEYIERLIPEDDRLEAMEGGWASPGFMRLRVHPFVANLVDRSLHRLAEDRGRLDGPYQRLHERTSQLRKELEARKEKPPKSVDANFSQLMTDLAAALGSVDLDAVRSVAGSDYIAAEFLLSYHNKLDQLARWTAGQKALML